MDDKQILEELVSDLIKNYDDLIYPKRKDGSPVGDFTKSSYKEYTSENRFYLVIETIVGWQNGVNVNINKENWQIKFDNNELKEIIFYESKLGYKIICKIPGKKKWNRTGDIAQRKYDFRPELNGNGISKHVFITKENYYKYN